MANHKETVHHMVFGLTIGMISEDGTRVIRNPKPVSLKAETYSKVTHAVISKAGEISQVDTVGIVMGCDQLQRNLVVKANRGNISIRVDQILGVKQYSSIEVLPGCIPEKVLKELPGDAIADDELAEDGKVDEDLEEGTESKEEHADRPLV